MESDILQGFIKQTQDYLPIIRGGILVCAQEGNTFGELDNALRQVFALKEGASIIGLDEIENLCADIHQKLSALAGLKQPITDKQSHELLDKLTELEALLTKIYFSSDDFSDNIADFVEESFGQFEIQKLEKESFVRESIPNNENFFEDKTTFEDDISEDEIIADEEEFEIDEEMLEIFAIEAEDLVGSININLEILAEKPNNREALMEIRRNAHTLKGSAGIIGFKKLSEVAHRVEDLLDFLAENNIDSDNKIFELLLTATDCFQALASGENSEQLTGKITRIYSNFDEIMANLQKQIQVEQIKEKDSPVANISETISENPILTPPTISPANRSVMRISLEKLDDLVNIVGDLVISRSIFEQRLGELDQQIKELHNSTRRLQSSTNKLETNFEADMLAVKIPESKFQPAGQTPNSAFIVNPSFDFDTLEFDRYTEFHQTTRELVETTGDTSAINSELDSLKSNLEMLFETQRSLIDEMQDKLLRLRMVYFGSLSIRLQRTVRVTCDEEGKSADLIIEGENLEVDTQILDALVEPLLHLLRNAVAHGIELPETRRLLGKSETGKIFLRVYSEGTHIIVVISDDGRGISASGLKDKAIKNGLISKEKADSMTKDEAFSLIFLPGLTTAERLSQISGRGIGMNIVKTGIERQSGTISLSSEAHLGTTFTLRLPMSLAVTRALLVKTGGQSFAFPLNLVKHISEISSEHLKKLTNSIRLGDINYKILYLNKMLNITSAEDTITENIPMLLIDILDNPCALMVDSVVKTEEIVIKPLGNPLRSFDEFLGATILGNGNVVPVLDLIYLLNKNVINQKPNLQNQPAMGDSLLNNKPKIPDAKLKIPKIMIVDDSPSVRHLTSNIIKNAGWKTIVAKDGLEALEILQEAKELPDVILTDVEMPRMDGYELLSSIKRLDVLRDIPVIMITSRAGDKHRQKAFGLGVAEYLTKPFDDAKLAEIIRKLS